MKIKSDADSNKLYISNRLSVVGRTDYPKLIYSAAEDKDDTWLASGLRAAGRLNAMEERRKPKGGFTMARVPVTAADTMAEGEFNRFYIRGLYVRALAENITELVIYRAKEVDNPRPESKAKIGQRISAQALMDDLRANVGVDTALGLPPGPNSGLSVKLP